MGEHTTFFKPPTFFEPRSSVVASELIDLQLIVSAASVPSSHVFGYHCPRASFSRPSQPENEATFSHYSEPAWLVGRWLGIVRGSFILGLGRDRILSTLIL